MQSQSYARDRELGYISVTFDRWVGSGVYLCVRVCVYVGVFVCTQVQRGAAP